MASSSSSSASLGNCLALQLNAPSFPTSTSQERKTHLVSHYILSSSPQRYHLSCMRKLGVRVVVVHGKAKSKFNGVDFDAAGSSDEEEEEEFEEDEGGRFDWEMEMRKRVKEAEEMKELEMKAEELQYRVDSDSQGREESEEEKRERVKREIEKVAKEQAERRATAKLMFELGQKAYGRGMYGRAVEFLEGALTIIPRPTLLGGEIQIWLAMAYDANNRHADCISLYQQLEKTHPSVSIRRQAAELRYIAQAPKLKISKEETVSIPLIGSSYDNYATYWSDKYKDNDRKITGTAPGQLPWSKDFLGDLFTWRPDTNRTFWVAFTLWLGLVGAAVLIQK